ncbi:ABC transporter permease [uncultured Faecalibaculum sp.]|uniref:ABC transporter permease n=1 Tax=uncultured Faecalibaculum sp. TaxID=1729681 RepID=UPI0025EBA892|nr:ABC transporter permease [uncultured Faecalibaculum sp.]
MGVLLSIEGAIGQGILWGIMALGVYITFRILDFADLTVDGSFATGGAVSAILIVNGVDPWLTLPVAILAGCLCGACTGLLHTMCKIPPILAGILTQIGLYSINLMIMDKSNLPLLKVDTIFSRLGDAIHLPRAISRWLTTNNLVCLLIGLLFAVIVIAFAYWFFGTETGATIRATGNNASMVRANGVSTNKTNIMALILSNAFICLSGALVAQQQGYADVKMGIGAIVIALASIVIGEVIFGRKGGFLRRLISIIVGSIIYRIIVAVVLQLGLNADNLKLFTAILVGVALTIPVIMDKRRQSATYRRLTAAADAVEEPFDA